MADQTDTIGYNLHRYQCGSNIPRNLGVSAKHYNCKSGRMECMSNSLAHLPQAHMLVTVNNYDKCISIYLEIMLQNKLLLQLNFFWLHGNLNYSLTTCYAKFAQLIDLLNLHNNLLISISLSLSLIDVYVIYLLYTTSTILWFDQILYIPNYRTHKYK